MYLNITICTVFYLRELTVWGAAGHAAGERPENQRQHHHSTVPAGGKNLKHSSLWCCADEDDFFLIGNKKCNSWTVFRSELYKCGVVSKDLRTSSDCAKDIRSAIVPLDDRFTRLILNLIILSTAFSFVVFTLKVPYYAKFPLTMISNNVCL